MIARVAVPVVPVAGWALGMVSGCGPDLARLETEEEALTREVTTLRTDVAEMRSRMEQMGLLPSGPVAAAAAASSGESDLDQELKVRVTREGTPPTFKDLGAPERRKNTDCGWRFGVEWLQEISDQKLDQSGSGKASPLILMQDGKPLEPHATPQASEKGCGFGFRHMPVYLFFAPQRDAENITGSWSLGLSEDLPMKRGGDKHEVYWVYPGTTLTFAFDQGWAEEWGVPTVSLDARVLYVGTPESPASQPGSPAVVTFEGREFPSTESKLGLQEVIEPPQGPWTLEIASPSDGPYVLLHTLVVGNEQHARVLAVEGRP
jgi:hypothetical protein